MKQISCSLMAITTITALVLIAYPLATVSATNGAVVTTTDESVDGTGHCLNGYSGGNCTPTQTQTHVPHTATFTPTSSKTPGPPTSTFTATPTQTKTHVPHTATFTPTSTPTSTSTATSTPTTTSIPPCQPTIVSADFSKVAVGVSVEGLGVVAPDLNIDANGTAVKILEAVDPFAFAANTSNGHVQNGGLAPGGGFTDTTAVSAQQAHHYTFTFAPGVSVSNFTLHMLDSGDYNPSQSPSHLFSISAYNANGFVIAKQEISYTTPPVANPTTSDLYGNPLITGDALTALSGQLGNWTWNLSASGIVKITLDFGAGFDPFIGFDNLTYTPDCLR